MPTNREAVSIIVNGLKSLNIDDRKSNRYILNQLKDKVSTLIKQDTDSRRLFAVSDVWKPIHCIDLKEVPASECCSEIPNLRTMMKSVQRIPQTYLSSYGNILKVFNIVGTLEYTQTTRAKYKDIMDREVVNNAVKYFWLSEGHIFIPNSDVEKVSAIGLFIHPHQVDILNDSEAECDPLLDQPFPAPDYILTIAKDQVLQEYAGISARIVEDEKANLNSNVKN